MDTGQRSSVDALVQQKEDHVENARISYNFYPLSIISGNQKKKQFIKVMPKSFQT